MLHHRDIIQHITSGECSHCGGETAGFKCPKCGVEGKNYDPHHFRNCKEKSKMRAKCKACRGAEDNCAC